MNWPEFDLDRVILWPMSRKLSLIAAISFLTMGLGYWFIVQSHVGQLISLKAFEEGLKREFKSMHEVLSKKQVYRRRLHDVQTRFDVSLNQMSVDNEMPVLLEQISKKALAAGLKLELFAPQQEVIYDFYEALPIKMIVKGGYFQLAHFFSAVAEMKRLVTMHEFTIQGPSLEKGKSKLGDDLVMTTTVKLYRHRVS